MSRNMVTGKSVDFGGRLFLCLPLLLHLLTQASCQTLTVRNTTLHLVKPEVCIQRTQRSHPPSQTLPEVGLVVAVCQESLSTLAKLPCRFGDSRIRIHVYKNCNSDSQVIREQLKPVEECTVLIEEGFIGMPMQHIVANHVEGNYRTSLPQKLLFVAPMQLGPPPGESDNSTAEASSFERLQQIVALSVRSKLAFKTFSFQGVQKSLVDVSRLAELCPLIQRYTCLDACSAITLRFLTSWASGMPAEASTFMVSKDRATEIPLVEYRWIRDWTARVPEATSKDLWSFLWGCPQETGSRTFAGCRPRERYQSGSLRTSPYELEGTSSDIVQPKILRVLPQECVVREIEPILHYIEEEEEVEVNEVSREAEAEGAEAAAEEEAESVMVMAAAVAEHGGQRRRSQRRRLQERAARGRGVGIVVVVCKGEELEAFTALPCDWPVTNMLYVYSKCGLGQQEAVRFLKQASRCLRSFRQVPRSLEQELSQEKHNREYLEHIITHYQDMQPITVFLQASFVKQPEDILNVINDMVDEQWTFKAYGLPKMIVEPDYFRRGGNRHIWRTELCALYRRYHCLDACAPDLTRAKAGYNSILYNTVPMWAAAASRIRSLPISEYMWWREYVSSPAYHTGIRRHLLLDHMWQAMLGCPGEHDETAPDETHGCRLGQSHPHGMLVAPPALPLVKGLVSWPAKASSGKGFDPSLASPGFQKSHTPAIPFVTFVTAFVERSPEADALRAKAFSEAMVASGKFHPGCKWLVLIDRGSKAGTFFDSKFWGSRLTVLELDAAPPQPKATFMLSVLKLNQKTATQPLMPRSSRLHLEAKFLETISQSRVRSTSHGDLVLTDFSSLPVSPLYGAYQSGETGERSTRSFQGPAISFPFSSTASAVIGGTWFVRRDGVAQAAHLSAAALHLAPKRRELGGLEFEEVYSQLFGCCMRDPLLEGRTPRTPGASSSLRDIRAGGPFSQEGQQAQPLHQTCRIGACRLPGGRPKDTAVGIRWLPCGEWLGSADNSPIQEPCPATGSPRQQPRMVHFGTSDKDLAAMQGAARLVTGTVTGSHGVVDRLLHPKAPMRRREPSSPRQPLPEAIFPGALDDDDEDYEDEAHEEPRWRIPIHPEI